MSIEPGSFMSCCEVRQSSWVKKNPSQCDITFSHNIYQLNSKIFLKANSIFLQNDDYQFTLGNVLHIFSSFIILVVITIKFTFREFSRIIFFVTAPSSSSSSNLSNIKFKYKTFSSTELMVHKRVCFFFMKHDKL